MPKLMRFVQLLKKESTMKQNFKTEDELNAFAKPLLEEKKYVMQASENTDGTFTLQWMEHKSYTTTEGNTFPDEIWTNKEGEMIHIQDLSPEHARNIIRLIIRNGRERRAMMEEVLGQVLGNLQEDSTEETEEPVSESSGHTLH
jgi:hypothetical protein